MYRKIFYAIFVSLICLTFSTSAWSQGDMVKASNYWLVHHNEIEKVINLAYYSWVDGDGDTYLSCFTPDVVWYYSDGFITPVSDPGQYNVWMVGKDELKKNVADKAEEVKENFTERWLVVRNIHVKRDLEEWLETGEVGNGHGIAVARVSEISINKETGETTPHIYFDHYMMKRINGKWMISGVIRKVIK